MLNTTVKVLADTDPVKILLIVFAIRNKVYCKDRISG